MLHLLLIAFALIWGMAIIRRQQTVARAIGKLIEIVMATWNYYLRSLEILSPLLSGFTCRPMCLASGAEGVSGDFYRYSFRGF